MAFGWAVWENAPHQKEFSMFQTVTRIALALLLVAVATPAAALDWKPYAVAAAGQALDVTTTLHQINTPALHCREANPVFGAHPSTLTLVLPKVALVVGVGLVLHLAETKGSTTARRVAKTLAYFSGGLGATAGVLNLRTCGW
jgi:hypothetical protein